MTAAAALENFPGNNATTIPALPAGVYFGLPAERYHADRALGSTDVRLIRKDPQAYWKGSWMNPGGARYKRTTKATLLGTALHCLVLDGDKKFRERYVRRPDDPAGAKTADKSAITKAANAKLLSHQILLKPDEWSLCMMTEDLITEHPDLRDVLDPATHLTEVSVFWNWNRIACKARFDILKPNGIGDIKTIENERDRPLAMAAKWDIKGYRYDIQAAHYMEGRRQLAGLVNAGWVYSVGIDGEPEPSKTSSIVAAVKHQAMAAACADRAVFGFQFIFVQKSYPAVWACTLSPGSSMLSHGRECVENALATYRAMFEAHGVKRWPQTWRLEELAVEEMPGGEFGWA